MKTKRFGIYWLVSCIGVIAASCYPLTMGIRVVSDMLRDGTVMKENYPKYIIPYTPIAVAVIFGVLLMPLCIKLCKRLAFAAGSVLSAGAFFALELLFEHRVVVTTEETVTVLKDWQMYMCYTPPGGWGETVTTYKTQTPVEILMGEYSPAFKLHFYVISVILILTILNCIYGFGQMIRTGEKTRRAALILQSVSSALFLGLCILACFTAFWRDGSLKVAPLSAALMTLFFVIFGICGGLFVGSFLLGKRRRISILIPALTASALTLLMYVGEMILLSSHLYILGTGFLFESIPGIVLSLFDIAVIIMSGALTAITFILLDKPGKKPKKRLLFIVLLCSLVLQLCSCATSTKEKTYIDLPCSQEGVDEFFEAFGGPKVGEGLISGIVFNNDDFYNVTPLELLLTECRVFKHSETCLSYVMIDNEVYDICRWFGGHGFVNAVPCDFDGDGEQELLIASSCGSGLHHSEISVFDIKTKKYTTVFSTADTENPRVDLIVRAYTYVMSSRKPDLASDTVYEVCFAEIKTDEENNCKLSYFVTGVAGKIVCKDGAAAFEPDPKADIVFLENEG